MTGYIMQTLSMGPADMPGLGNQRLMVRRGLRRLASVGRCLPQLRVRDRPVERRGARWLRPHGGFVSGNAAAQMGRLVTDGADIWVSGNDSTFQGDFSSVTELSTSNPDQLRDGLDRWKRRAARGAGLRRRGCVGSKPRRHRHGTECFKRRGDRQLQRLWSGRGRFGHRLCRRRCLGGVFQLRRGARCHRRIADREIQPSRPGLRVTSRSPTEMSGSPAVEQARTAL